MPKSIVSRQEAKWLTLGARCFLGLAEFIDRVRDRCLPHAYEPTSTIALDRAVAVGFAFSAAAITYYGISSIDPRVYDSWNIYFQADGIRVLADMTDRFSEQWRTNVHPIFSIMTFPLMHFLMALGLQKVAAANVLLLVCAAVSGGLFYLALRGLGLSMIAAAVFDTAFLASATFIHWYPYVETYPFASTTIVALLYMLTSGRQNSVVRWGLACAAVLGIGIVNWALALAATFFRLPFRTFVKLSIGVFTVVAVIACLQRVTFPTSTLFFNPRHYTAEIKATQLWLEKQGITQWNPSENIRSVLITSAVAPRATVEDADTPVGVFRLVNNQSSRIWQSPVTGIVAVALWVLLLCLGCWGAWQDKSRWPVALPIVAYLIFQSTIYLFYGEITFLYAGNFFPALMLLACFGWFTPLRKLALAAAATFAIFAGITNELEFQRANRMSSEIAAQLAATGEALCVPTCALGRRGR